MKTTYEALVALGLADLVDVVEEPAYSQDLLKKYEEKYHISTQDFLRFFDTLVPEDTTINDIAEAALEDLNDWYFAYCMVIQAGGDGLELHGFQKPRLDDITIKDEERRMPPHLF